MDKYAELLNLVTALKDDYERFYEKGSGAAGTRVRKGLQDIAAYAKATRTEIQEKKNSK